MDIQCGELNYLHSDSELCIKILCDSSQEEINAFWDTYTTVSNPYVDLGPWESMILL